LIQSAIRLFGSAPVWVAATSPSLKIISVGMARTPYFVGVFGLSSMLILVTLT